MRLYRNLAKLLQAEPPNQVLTKTLALNIPRSATGPGSQVEKMWSQRGVFTGRAESRAKGLARMFWGVGERSFKTEDCHPLLGIPFCLRALRPPLDLVSVTPLCGKWIPSSTPLAPHALPPVPQSRLLARSFAHCYPKSPWAPAPETRLGLSAFSPLNFVLSPQ